MRTRAQLLAEADRCGMLAARFAVLAGQWRSEDRPALASCMTMLAIQSRERGALLLTAAQLVADVPEARQTAVASAVASANALAVSP